MDDALQPLYRGGWFSIERFRCSGGSPTLGPEEASPLHNIALVRSGAFFRQVGKRKALADANQVLFFNRYESYRVAHPPGLRDECLVVTPSLGALRELLASHDPGAAERADPFREPSAPCTTTAFAAQQRLVSAARAGGVDHLAIEATTLELLDECLRPLARRPAPPPVRRPSTEARHRELTEAVKELLSLRLGEDLRLHAIARSIGAAPFHLARLFRRHTALPIHRYRRRLRLRAALRRVAEGASDLSALALELGFSDHSHLTRDFRAEFGTPPSRWRRLAARG